MVRIIIRWYLSATVDQQAYFAETRYSFGRLKRALTHEHFVYRPSQDLGFLTLFVAEILRFVLLRYILVTKKGCSAQELASQDRCQLLVDGKMCNHCRYVATCRFATNDETSFRRGFQRSGVLCGLAEISAKDVEGLEGVKTNPFQSIP